MNPNGGTPDSQPAPSSEPQAPKPAPVMDVVPPRADPYIHAPAANVPQETVAEPPVDDMDASEITDESPEKLIEEETQPHEHEAQSAAKPVKAHKQPGTGMGLAITATVIIVLVLAVLATYAYLQTNK